jgi:hypothetical protein
MLTLTHHYISGILGLTKSKFLSYTIISAVGCHGVRLESGYLPLRKTWPYQRKDDNVLRLAIFLISETLLLGGKSRWQWKNVRYAERKSIQSIILSKNAPNAVPGSATITLGITNGNVFCVRPIRSAISTKANNHSAYVLKRGR